MKLIIVFLVVCCLSVVLAKEDRCNQPAGVKGDGSVGSFTKFTYNKKDNKCVQFTWTGHGGNDNMFETEWECSRSCKETCSSPPKFFGKAALVEFYYNQTRDECVEFIFGGFPQNDNHFKTKTLCERSCIQTKTACIQPPYRNSLAGSTMTRYSFDKRYNECKAFSYSGKYGNSNNFKTQSECEITCIDPCEQRPFAGKTSANNHKRYSYNSARGRCQLFSYMGQGGNDNNFQTLTDCTSQCSDPCSHRERDVGNGTQKLERWSYDSDNPMCSMFIYKGEKGNKNNFKSKTECMNTCYDPCRQPILEKGDGTGVTLSERYAYNDTQVQCKRMYYWGSGGNRNNFITKTDCLIRCRGIKDEKCDDKIFDNSDCPPKGTYVFDKNSKTCKFRILSKCPTTENRFETEANCTATCLPPDPCIRKPTKDVEGENGYPRYYYESGSCKKFVFNGKGTDMYFQTERECLQCKKDPCMEQFGVTGVCRAIIGRYSFNPVSQTCEQFSYGGCGGTRNNFKKLEDCKKTCVKD